MTRRALLFLTAVLFSVSITGATKAGTEWQVTPINTPAPAHSSVPRVTAGQQDKLLLSWLEKKPDGYAFRFSTWRGGKWSLSQTIASGSSLLASASSAPGLIEMPGGALVAQWLTSSAKEDANEIVLAVSRDGGKSWSHPVKPHRDGTPGEHMYVSLFQWPQGGAGVVWLDPRNGKTSALMQATIDDSGKLGPEAMIAGDVCDCCPTSSAFSSAGPVVMYRNRTPANIRDMYLSRFSNGRMQTGTPIHPDGWKIDGCPTNSGNVVALGDKLAAAWFTASNRDPRIELAFSNGDTFSNPIDIERKQSVGRVALAALPDQSVLVTWLTHGAQGVTLRAAQASSNGIVETPVEIASAGAAGKLGFPFVASVPGGVFAVWTDFQNDQAAGIRAAILTKSAR